MNKTLLKVRSSPENLIWRETEEVANPQLVLLIVSVLSTNRAILSHGCLKPNFINNEKRKFKKTPSLEWYT